MRINWLRDIAVKLGSVGAVVLLINSCGAVTDPTPTTPPAVGGSLLVLPATADLFPEIPTQFSVSGGTPPYSVFSSNAIVLPIDAAVSGTSFTAIPKIVATDTPVTLTVRDNDGKTTTAAVIIRPAVINNIFTLTTGSTDCGATALCSGGSAQVSVTAMLNGAALQNRPIRFDVYQGDYSIVTPGTGAQVTTLTINTDANGQALVRLLASSSAPTQVATLAATDVTSGMVRRFSFNIVAKALSVLPSGSVTFVGGPGGGGEGSGQCPTGAVDYYIFGGSPPYTVFSPLPGLATVTPGIVTTSGGSFRASLAGCGEVAFIVTDSVQQSIETAKLIGTRGPDGSAPVPPTATTPVVSPPALTFSACGQSGVVILSGTGGWVGNFAAGGSPGLSFTPTSGTLPGTVTITRSSNPTPAAATPDTVVINFTNSAGTGTLRITNTGSALGNCP